MIVRVPPRAAVDVWAVGSDGRRVARAADGVLDVPDGAVLEVRGRRRAQVKLAWLTELTVPVVSVDVRRSEVSAFELMAATSLPHLAVLTAAGAAIDGPVVAAVAQAENLAVLQLVAPALQPGDLFALHDARKLRQVRLEVPHVPPGEVIDALGRRSLTVFGLTAPRMTAGLFERVVGLWPLRELSVTVEYLDPATLGAARRLTNLTQLAVDGISAPLTGWDVASLVQALPVLGQLDLAENGRPLSPGTLVAAWWLRPGLRINGLSMSQQATARFVERWTGS